MAAIFPAYIAYGHDASHVREFLPASDSTHVVGDLVFADTSSPWDMNKCGADPSLIAAVSEVISDDADALTPDGKVPYRILSSGTVVAMCGTSDPTDSTAVGTAYGVVNANGVWKVDLTDTSNTRVLVIGVDTVNLIYFVRFLAANLQFDAVAS